jgi:ASC-1-like (ASCH) protein
MKTHSLVFAESSRKNFQAIKDGLKKVETRAATPKYQKIKEGDYLRIVCGEDEIIKKVKSTKRYSSINDLFSRISLTNVMPYVATIDEARSEYYSYPNYKEKIAEFGLVAFELD